MIISLAIRPCSVKPPSKEIGRDFNLTPRVFILPQSLSNPAGPNKPSRETQTWTSTRYLWLNPPTGYVRRLSPPTSMGGVGVESCVSCVIVGVIWVTKGRKITVVIASAKWVGLLFAALSWLCGYSEGLQSCLVAKGSASLHHRPSVCWRHLSCLARSGVEFVPLLSASQAP